MWEFERQNIIYWLSLIIGVHLVKVSQTDYILLSYDPWNKASIVICSADNSTYLPPMQELCSRDFCYLFLGDAWRSLLTGLVIVRLMSQTGGLLLKKRFQHSWSIHITYYLEFNLWQSKIVSRDKLLNGNWASFSSLVYFDHQTNRKWHNMITFIEIVS